MEMRMTTDLETALPAEIGFNFDELKVELTERLHHYNNLVVTEDAIKEAKADLAKLRKLRDAIDTRRKEVKRQYMEPYNAFEARAKELTALIDAPVAAINNQVKAFENMEKEQKRNEIQAAYDYLVPATIKEIIPLDRILDPRWLNKSTTMKSVEEAITKIAQRTNVDLTLLETTDPKHTAAVMAKYIETLDITTAMNHRDRLIAAEAAFQQREAERVNNQPQVRETPPAPAQEPVVEAPRQEHVERIFLLRLELQLSKAQATALKRFLVENNINHQKI